MILSLLEFPRIKPIFPVIHLAKCERQEADPFLNFKEAVIFFPLCYHQKLLNLLALEEQCPLPDLCCAAIQQISCSNHPILSI